MLLQKDHLESVIEPEVIRKVLKNINYAINKDFEIDVGIQLINYSFYFKYDIKLKTMVLSLGYTFRRSMRDYKTHCINFTKPLHVLTPFCDFITEVDNGINLKIAFGSLKLRLIRAYKKHTTLCLF